MKFDPQSVPAAYVSEVSDEQPQRVTKDSEVRTPPPPPPPPPRAAHATDGDASPRHGVVAVLPFHGRPRRRRCCCPSMETRPVTFDVLLMCSVAQVRLRVVATRIDASEIFAIGTIKDEYLGLVE
jgi:hypothetical protein